MVILLIPIDMRTYLSRTFSCDSALWERLTERFPDGTHQRSAFITKCIRTGLDADDITVQIGLKKDKWFKDKVVPEVRKLVKKHDYGYILELWSGSPGVRDTLRKNMSTTVNDDELKRALSEVLKEYE